MSWISVISRAFHSGFPSRTLEMPSRSWNTFTMHWLLPVKNEFMQTAGAGMCGANRQSPAFQPWRPSHSLLLRLPGGGWRPSPGTPRGALWWRRCCCVRDTGWTWLVTRVLIVSPCRSGQACPELPVWTQRSVLDAASWQARAGDRC